MQHPDASIERKTILVVEDDHDTREYLTILLGMAGYTVVEALSGKNTFSIIVNQPVAAILLDLRLPDLDGLEVARYLRAHGYADIPIILITADMSKDIEGRAEAAGVTICIKNPFDPQLLIDELHALLSA